MKCLGFLILLEFDVFYVILHDVLITSFDNGISVKKATVTNPKTSVKW